MTRQVETRFGRSADPWSILMSVLVSIVSLFMLSFVPSLVQGEDSLAAEQWVTQGGDKANTKYSPLDQINRENVKDLEIAWTWKAIEATPRASTNSRATPLLLVRFCMSPLDTTRRRPSTQSPARRSGSTLRKTFPAGESGPPGCAVWLTGPTARARESSWRAATLAW